MLYKITNGSVSYGADTILEDIEFEIKDKEKIAIVGRNGCGKTTLLKAITGEVGLDEGTGEDKFSVAKSGINEIGYLKQTSFQDDSVSMLDEVVSVYKPILEVEREMEETLTKMESDKSEKLVKRFADLQSKYEFLGGYTYKKEYLTAIKEFGFSESDKKKRLSEFSGGQRTKIAFIKLLLSKPDILLLDEPTNHLDVRTIEWLESYLKNYKSAVVIVSHDRMFIDRIVNTVYEIEYGETKKYVGKYSDFEKLKRQNYEKQLKDFEMQRAEIDRLMRIVEKFRYKASKAKFAQSKLKYIEHMKKIDAPSRYDLRTFHATFQPQTESVKDVLFVKDLQIGYDKPLQTVNFAMQKGQKLGIIGANGIGKSTLVKTLVGDIKSLGGRIDFGLKVQIGYFEQQMAEFKSNKTVYDEFYDEFPRLNETEVRSALGAFMFTGEDVFKQVDKLSGGEKVRLALCKIFKRRPNFLILDEPTNHMDIVGKETLENMLKEYEGTLIVVSHDRYFIDKIADRLLVFDASGVKYYDCGFTEYEKNYKEIFVESTDDTTSEKQEKEVKPSNVSPLKEKTKKLKRKEKLESLIAETDEKIKKINAELELPEVYSNYVKVEELQKELDALSTEQDAYYEEWTEISEFLENA